MKTTMTKSSYPATLLADFYKLSHREQYPTGTEIVYSTFTPRSNRYLPTADNVVVFGIQAFVKKYLIGYFDEHFFNRPKEDIIAEYKRLVKFTLGAENPDASHLEELHDLGYLPIEVKALPEGTLSPIKIPVMTIENTHPKFFWLTNYLETLVSNEIWQPMTSATISHQYRKLLDEYAIKTTGDTSAVGFQAHDFSMRGMSSLESAMASGAGHLLSFVGTDTIPAILYLEDYYNADIEKELVGTSIPATEHSVMSANTSADNRDETAMYKRLLTEIYPTGLFSVVSDTYDFWKVIGEILPALKDIIMNRDGKMVIRPDSGDPIEILCGKEIIDLTNEKYIHNLEDAKESMFEDIVEKVRQETPHGTYGQDRVIGEFKYFGKYYRIQVGIDWNRHDKHSYFIDDSEIEKFEEFTPSIEELGLIEALWNIFKGTISAQGYKVLDSHIGAIYGDSITLERAREICRRLAAKGFASTNVVFGIGSFTFQYNTRDSLGFAMKATYAEVNGEPKMLLKDPKTDDGTKKSLRGRVAVIEDFEGNLYVKDGYDKESYAVDEVQYWDELETVFLDGKLVRDQSLSEIRSILEGTEQE